jgi:hypothetical protein
MAGTGSSFSFKIEGKTLTLTTVTGRLGPIANPVTFTLTRVE